jgi:hypothetical protein
MLLRKYRVIVHYTIDKYCTTSAALDVAVDAEQSPLCLAYQVLDIDVRQVISAVSESNGYVHVGIKSEGMVSW